MSIPASVNQSGTLTAVRENRMLHSGERFLRLAVFDRGVALLAYANFLPADFVFVHQLYTAALAHGAGSAPLLLHFSDAGSSVRLGHICSFTFT